MVNLADNALTKMALEERFPCATILDAIHATLAEQAAVIATKNLRVELDVDDQARGHACDAQTREAVDSLARLAIERSQFGSELFVSAVRTSQGVEIEIADSGPQLDQNRTSICVAAFAKTSIHELQNSSAFRLPERRASTWQNMYCSRCPQGGVAWTIILQDRLSVKRVA